MPPRNDSPTVNMQGVMVPQQSINPQLFMQATRRQRTALPASTFPGFGGASEPISIQKAGILGALHLEFTGSLVVTLNGGTCATTGRWPYDFVSRFRFSANGASNLHNYSGWHCKAREIMQRGDLNDRGITRTIGGASVNQGTLSLASENWGVGQNTTAIAGGTYPVELSFRVPIAHDDVYLVGAVLAQTSATDLLLNLDYAPQADLFILTGGATVAMTGTWSIVAETYSIPMANGSMIVLPDLSYLHQIVQSNVGTVINGENEQRLSGQGVGRQVLRMWTRTINGAAKAPLAINATNFGPLGWRYGTNETPELEPTGRHLARRNERVFGNDMGTQGFAIFDFANENSFRDTVDQGAATEMRFVQNVQPGVTLTNPVLEMVQELLIPGALPAAA